jgi:hypothetical protein
MTLEDEIAAIDYAISHMESEMKARPPSEERRKAMREVIQTLNAMRAVLLKQKRRAAH